MGKQQQTILQNYNQILIWHNEHKPTDWIAKQLRVSRELLKRTYPEYRGRQGLSIEEINTEINYNISPKKCLICNKSIEFKLRNNIFCSHSCAATNSNSQNKGLSKHLKCKHCNNLVMVNFQTNHVTCVPCKERRRKELYKRLPFLKPFTNICVVCGKEFKAHTIKIKTCGKECYSKLASKNAKANPNCGGETNYKRYRYNGILMDSSWEVKLAEFFDKNNIKWERSKSIILYWVDKLGEKRRYHPDFYLPNYGVYVDPKNSYKQQLDADKLKRVLENNNVTLFIGNVKELQEKIMRLIYID